MKALARFLGLLLAAFAATAQPAPMPVVSPEVNADHTVTFRYFAPNAREVVVRSDFGPPLPMSRGADGVWSATTRPLPADLYSYWLLVDNIGHVDPANIRARHREDSIESIVEVSGPGADFLARRAVPHGQVHRVEYLSAAYGNVRHVLIYTPPGFDPASGKTYPALYLLHGMGMDEESWTRVGRADLIFDNLLAEGRIAPALIVMPFGHASVEDAKRRMAGLDRKHPPPADAFFQTGLLARDLIDTVIPLVEHGYHAAPDREHRAIAGLSMGGCQSLAIGLRHREIFSAVAGFSSAIVGPDPEAVFAPLLTDAAAVNRDLRLLRIACGADDGLLPNDKRFDAFLEQNGVRHDWIVTPGYAHVWPLWRRDLRDLLVNLYQTGR